jgi:hypothetical protein
MSPKKEDAAISKKSIDEKEESRVVGKACTGGCS